MSSQARFKEGTKDNAPDTDTVKKKSASITGLVKDKSAPSVKSGTRSANKLMSRSEMSRAKLKRRSYGFGSVSGIRRVQSSAVGIQYRRPVLKYFPSYRLDPVRPFRYQEVQDIFDEIVSDVFDRHKYHSQDTPALALRLSYDILTKAKDLNFDRYRFISVVTIGQKRAQSYNNAVAFLWDSERDCYANFTRETRTCFIHITVFAIYLD